MSEEIKSFQTMLLLGAGSSMPAGIPSIDKMTEEFLEHPLSEKKRNNLLEDEKAYRRKFKILYDIAYAHFRKSDLELMMSVIINLLNSETRGLFESRYYEFTKDLYRYIKNGKMTRYGNHDKVELLLDLKSKVESYIRNKCEKIETIDYLWPLDALLVSNNTLEIFTLNYDATIEIFCEKNGISVTDGFDPYWNSTLFAKETRINLYKLHGSLYWLRTESGKAIKVPIKGLNVSDVKYLTDESLSEMMIYPHLQKNKEPIVYSWLSQKFKEFLNKFDTCIVIGYSFRDDDIKDTILESVLGNNHLWLILVNPHASRIKNRLFSSNSEISSKIVVMDMGMEEALRNRKLHSYLDTLDNARRQEDEVNQAQKRSLDRLDSNWNSVIRSYLATGHHDRVKLLVERLREEKFDGVSGNFPDNIEGIVVQNSLQYAFEYIRKKDAKKSEIWKQIFLEGCTALEYTFFENERPDLREYNPVKKDQLPLFCSGRGGNSVTHKIEELKKKLTEFDSAVDKRTRLKKSLSKLIETLNIITYKEYLKSGGYKSISTEDIIKAYQDKDIGFRKWALEVVKNLE